MVLKCRRIVPSIPPGMRPYLWTHVNLLTVCGPDPGGAEAGPPPPRDAPPLAGLPVS